MSKKDSTTAEAVLVTPSNVPEAVQLDLATVERACEVQRIAVKHELKKMIRRHTEERETASVRFGTLRDRFMKELEPAIRADLAKKKEMVELANMLRTVLGVKISADQLVKDITPADRKTDREICNYRAETVVDAMTLDCRHIYMSLDFFVGCWPVTNKKEDESDEDEEDDKGRRRTLRRGYLQDFAIPESLVPVAKELRELNLKMDCLWASIKELEERKERSKELNEGLKAQILRKQIQTSVGGAEILAMMDKATDAAVHGRYLSLL